MILGMLLWFSASFGLQNGGVGDDITYYNLPPVFATIEIHAENEWLDNYGVYYNGMFDKIPSFLPAQDVFTVGTSFTYENFSLSLEHACFHPVSNSPLEDLNGYWGGYNRIFITVDSRR